MPSSKCVILSLLLLPALVLCVPTKRASCSHAVPGVGTFMNHASYSFNGNSLPPGLYKNTDTVGGTPFARTYDPALATVSSGFLNLRVPGGQTSSPIRGAGVNTLANDILYASVRTRAIFSTIPGTVQSTFFYKSDTAEIDLEYLSDGTSATNSATQAPALHYTNHGRTSTTAQGINPGTAALREYRIDWLPGVTRFYVDGVLQQALSENVPTVGGTWIWNNWSNGDRGFSVGPPRTDSTMRIQGIEMWWNGTRGCVG